MPYIAYLTDPDQHTNTAASHPGKGDTKEEARENALYWNNQWPWVRTIAASKAPRWAQNTARDARWNDLESRSAIGDLTTEEVRELESYCAAELYA